VAAEAERAFRSTTRPHRLQIDADGGKNRDVKNGKDALRQGFRLLKFERDTAEAEVQHTSAAGTLLTDDGVGVRANHGDTLGFTLNRKRGWCFGRRRGLLREGASSSGRSICEVGGRFFGWAASRDGDERSRHGRWRGRRWGRGTRRAIGGERVIGVLQAIEAFVGDAHQLIGLIAVLWEIGHAVIHGHWEGELQGAQSLRKNRLDTAAESQGLSGIGLRQKEREFVAANAEGGVRGAQRFLESGGGGTEDLVAARMTVLIVHFLEAVQVQDDDAERKTVAAGAVEFFLEGFGKQAAIVETGERVGDSIDLEFFVLFVFEHNRNANQAGGRKDIHQNCFERHGTSKLIREFAAAREDFLPEVKALRLAQIEMRGGAKIALQELTARGNVHDVERVREELEVGVFHGQTRGRWGSGTGHVRVFLQSASPRGGWGKHIWMTDPKREQIKCQSRPCVQPASTERRCQGDVGILLQNEEISEIPEGTF